MVMTIMSVFVSRVLRKLQLTRPCYVTVHPSVFKFHGNVFREMDSCNSDNVAMT